MLSHSPYPGVTRLCYSTEGRSLRVGGCPRVHACDKPNTTQLTARSRQSCAPGVLVSQAMHGHTPCLHRMLSGACQHMPRLCAMVDPAPLAPFSANFLAPPPPPLPLPMLGHPSINLRVPAPPCYHPHPTTLYSPPPPCKSTGRLTKEDGVVAHGLLQVKDLDPLLLHRLLLQRQPQLHKVLLLGGLHVIPEGHVGGDVLLTALVGQQPLLLGGGMAWVGWGRVDGAGKQCC